ncbi:MAG TPA: hypothetical protein VGQ38_01490 [Gaiellaceae bacterium]|nr:hypothetical protein [Gaiellaceae bacterium]
MLVFHHARTHRLWGPLEGWPLVAFVILRGRARGRLGLALVAQLPLALSGSGRAVAPYTAILVGCVLAFVMHNRSSFTAVAKLGTRTGLALSLGALVGVQALTHAFTVTAPGYRVASPWYYLPYSAAVALLVASLALQAPGSGVFRSQPMRFVGRVSYPLCLLHPLAFGFVAVAIKPGGDAVELVYFAVGLALSLVLAWVVHRIVEQPLIAIGKRLASRPWPTSPFSTAETLARLT